MNSMKLFKFKQEIYQDLKLANRDIIDLKQKITCLEKDISSTKERNDYYRDNLENLYNTLKTIRSLTKDKTIETLCILKMEDIYNMTGIYISE